MKRKITDLLILSPLNPLKGRIAVYQHSRFFNVNTPLRGQGVTNIIFMLIFNLYLSWQKKSQY